MGTVTYLDIETKEEKATREAIELVYEQHVANLKQMKKRELNRWFMIAHLMHTVALTATESMKGSGVSADTIYDYLQTVLDDIKDPQVHEA